LAAGAAEGLAKHGDEAAAGAEAGGDAVAKHADNTATACTLHSFDPDTPVLMADGTTKPIKDVKVGDEVKATEPETGETEVRTVTQLHINHDTELTDLTVEVEGSGKTDLHTTKHHPFWDATEGRWVDAADFQVGHELRTAEGGTAVVTAVRNFVGGREMRDLTVADIHTYYVLAGAAPVLVHNCGDGAEERLGAMVDDITLQKPNKNDRPGTVSESVGVRPSGLLVAVHSTSRDLPEFCLEN
jgi:Pretoxin HINT domain